MATVVLIHGAWHGAWCWDEVVAELERRGVNGLAVELPLTGFVDDVATAREAIHAAGPGSVVVGHSYGGLVVSEAASGVEGLRRLVYLAALMTENDEDQAGIVVEHGSPILACLTPIEGGIAVDPAQAARLFFGDSDDRTVASSVSRLRPMALGGSLARASEPAWKTVPSTYVVCTNDVALPPSAQREMSTRANEVIEWPTDHSPFLTRPAAIADLLAGYL